MSVPSFISSCNTRPSLLDKTAYTRPASVEGSLAYTACHICPINTREKRHRKDPRNQGSKYVDPVQRLCEKVSGASDSYSRGLGEKTTTGKCKKRKPDPSTIGTVEMSQQQPANPDTFFLDMIRKAMPISTVMHRINYHVDFFFF